MPMQNATNILERIRILDELIYSLIGFPAFAEHYDQIFKISDDLKKLKNTIRAEIERKKIITVESVQEINQAIKGTQSEIKLLNNTIELTRSNIQDERRTIDKIKSDIKQLMCKIYQLRRIQLYLRLNKQLKQTHQELIKQSQEFQKDLDQEIMEIQNYQNQHGLFYLENMKELREEAQQKTIKLRDQLKLGEKQINEFKEIEFQMKLKLQSLEKKLHYFQKIQKENDNGTEVSYELKQKKPENSVQSNQQKEENSIQIEYITRSSKFRFLVYIFFIFTSILIRWMRNLS